MSRAGRTAHGIMNSRLTRGVVLVLAIAVAAFSFEHVPAIDVVPVLYGLVPWSVGTYVLCPLRWHGISTSGRSRSWHLRVYAESELLGLLTPAHTGADLWRVRQLRTTGLDGRSAYAEVGLDRLLAGAGLLVFVAVSGGGLPPEVLVPVLATAVLGGLAWALVRRRRPAAARRPLPSGRALLRGVGLSVLYQGMMFGLLLGGAQATGQHVSLLTLLGAFGASQAASLVPGVHGCSAREGALVAGLAASGASVGAAIGIVSVVTVAAWAPALVFGGGSLLLRRLQGQWHVAVPAVLVGTVLPDSSAAHEGPAAHDSPAAPDSACDRDDRVVPAGPAILTRSAAVRPTDRIAAGATEGTTAVATAGRIPAPRPAGERVGARAA